MIEITKRPKKEVWANITVERQYYWRTYNYNRQFFIQKQKERELLLLESSTGIEKHYNLDKDRRQIFENTTATIYGFA
jgi:hypothetical protein